MPLNREPRFVNHPGMLLAGLRQTHALASAQQSIPAQWQQFRDQVLPQLPAHSARYGAIGGADHQQMDYLCAVEVEHFDDVPDITDRMHVPAQHYAVFTHSGSISGIAQSWQTIMETLMPELGLHDARTPPFELYDERYDVEKGEGLVEIWIPILKT